MTGRPIAIATKHATADVTIMFVESEVIYPFSPRWTIISNNANCFSTSTLMDAMKKFGIKWKPAFAAVSKAWDEIIVGTVRQSESSGRGSLQLSKQKDDLEGKLIDAHHPLKHQVVASVYIR